MYQVYADGICIFSDTSPDAAYKALSPRLTLTAGAAGSLSITLPQGTAGYDAVSLLDTTVRVERDGEVIWMGRPITEKKEIYGSREIFCEGALAWLNDIVPMQSYHTLQSVLAAYNYRVRADRQIAYGGSAYGGVSAEADGSSALEIINSRLVGALGGVLRMTYPGGIPTLEWLDDYPPGDLTAQTIRLGSNLLDFTRSWDVTELATYAYVRGAEIQGSNPRAYYSSGWVTLGTSADDPAGRYGRIERYLDYSDLQSNLACLDAARAYLRQAQFAGMELEMTAVDLHIINPGYKPFGLLERVRVESPPQGLAAVFAITNMTIPLDAPESTTYTLAQAELPYKRRISSITKATQQTLEQAQAYTDAAAETAASDTRRAKATLEARDAEIVAQVQGVDGEVSALQVTVEGISTRVSNAEGAISTVSQTADEIKAQVTDAAGNYTVANLKADGFHIGNADGRTLITGSMIDVDTIRVNKLYGNTIYLNDSSGNAVGSLSVSGTAAIAERTMLGISFAMLNLQDCLRVYFHSPSNIVFQDGRSLQDLLDAKANA